MNPGEKIQLSTPGWLLPVLQLANAQIWLQALGRLLCQVGAGLLYFYIPLVFVNQVGLSATAVGLSVGLSSLTGILGHLLGGWMADSPRFGRKRTLLFSGGIGALVSFLLGVTSTLPLLVIANLLLGLSVGFYWTAADAAVMDVTEPEERPRSFAVMNVAENLGNGLGILGGGALLVWLTHAPQLSFVACGGIYLLFVLMVQLTMPETRQANTSGESSLKGFGVALRDQALIVFILANVLFTTDMALVNSTLPLYFTNFVPALGGGPGATVASTANLFTFGYIGVGAVLQIPVAHLFRRWPQVRVLRLASVLWALGFGLAWVTGIVDQGEWFWGVSALVVMAIASVTYKPFAASIVAQLAPANLRGAYVAISSQCWAIGYFVGPSIGGWAMDQPVAIADGFWLAIAATSGAGLLVLWLFNRIYCARDWNLPVPDSGPTPSAS